MNTPTSAIELLALQPYEVLVNYLLTRYLEHHPDTPARLRVLVERAIACPQLAAKEKVLCFVMAYG
jgi:hypothetical protein